MPTLRNLQKKFGTALFANTQEVNSDKLALRGINIARFNIYRRNFKLGHIHALIATYPETAKAMGPDLFPLLADQFISKIPIVNSDLNYFGRAFPDFLVNASHLKLPKHCSDLARFEWCWHSLQYAPNLITKSRISEIPETAYSHLLVQSAPSVEQLRLNYPVYLLWEKLRTGKLSNKRLNALKFKRSPTSVIFWIHQGNAKARAVDSATLKLISFLKNAKSLRSVEAKMKLLKLKASVLGALIHEEIVTLKSR